MIKQDETNSMATTPKFTQFNEVSAKVSEAPIEEKKTIKKDLADAKVVKADKASYTLKFAEGSNLTSIVYFEQIDAYLGYDTKDKKANTLTFAPDLSYNRIITGDNSQTDKDLKWGLTCDDNNSCKSSGIAPNFMYHTFELDKPLLGKTDMYFDKGRKYDDFSSFTNQPDIYFVKNTNSTWPLMFTGVVGMGPQSAFLKYVVENYSLNNDDSLQFSFFYDIMKRDTRFTANQKDSFSITMNWFGQNKDNLQSSTNFVELPEQSATNDVWTMSANQITINDVSIITDHTSPNMMITNVKNAYMALPPAELAQVKIQINSLLGCNSTPCQKKDVDLTDEKYNDKFVSLVLNADASGKLLTLKIPVGDLVYAVDKVDDLQYSIDDYEDWVASGVASTDASVKRGLGRQFLLNTYLVFNWNKKDVKHITIGQLRDLGKITNSERLWLMIFGATIVALILIVLIIKLACSKKETYNDRSNDDYLKHES